MKESVVNHKGINLILLRTHFVLYRFYLFRRSAALGERAAT